MSSAISVALVAVVASTSAAAICVGCNGATDRISETVPTEAYSVLRTYPHDAGAFTEGLEYRDGRLYEGTGLLGRSSIRSVRLETGEILQRYDLAPRYFGEGITIWKRELIQLTWRPGLAFVRDLDTLGPRRTFSYKGEGWGLTHDNTSLIMSDGTSVLRWLDPDTFVERRWLNVTEAGKAVERLNELEFVKGSVLANVLNSDIVVRIDPRSGHVIGRLDFGQLSPGAERSGNTHNPNGIAYDAIGDRLFVTGKRWSRLFEIHVDSNRKRGP